MVSGDHTLDPPARALPAGEIVSLYRGLPSFLLLTLLLAWAPGCLFFENFDDTFSADSKDRSPCYEVSLLDGISEESSSEIENLFACVNASGAFDPVAPLVDVVVTDSLSDGSLVWQRLARAVNAAVSVADLDAALAGVKSLAETSDEGFLWGMALVDEWIFGQPWPTLEGVLPGSAEEGASLVATEGPLIPLLDAARQGAEAILLGDDVVDLTAVLNLLLHDDAVAGILEPLGTLLKTNPTHHLLDDLPPQVVDLLLKLGQFGFGQPWETDIRVDLLLALAGEGGEEGALQTLIPMLDGILDGEVNHRLFVDELARLHQADLLQRLPQDLWELTQVDAWGDPLPVGDPGDPNHISALEALLLLLDGANQEECLDFGEGPMTVARFALETLYSITADPEDLDSLTAFQDIIDWAAGLAGGFAFCGFPNDIDHYTPAISVLLESPALDSLIPLLGAAIAPGEEEANVLPELLELFSSLIHTDLLGTVDGLIAEVAREEGVAGAVHLLGALATSTEGVTDESLYASLDLLAVLVHPTEVGDSGSAPLVRLLSPLAGVFASSGAVDSLDLALLRFQTLLSAQESHTAHLFDLLEWLPEGDESVSANPEEGEGSESLALDSEDVRLALLLVSDPELLGELARGNEGGRESTLGFLGRLLGDGTGRSLLGVVKWLAQVLEDVD